MRLKHWEPKAPEIIPGMTGETIPGARLLQVHYSADPDKQIGSDWQRDMYEKTLDKREWAVQMEMEELYLDGKVVFPTFEERLHAPLAYATKKIPYVAGSKIYCGWDCGNTVHPAFQMLMKFTVDGWPMVANLGEIVAVEAGTAFVDFLPAVSGWVQTHYPQISLSRAVHGADESGQGRNGVNGFSAFDAARDFGLSFIAVTNQWQTRRDAVARLLADRQELKDGSVLPRFMMSRMMSPTTFEGFMGGYRLRHVAQGNAMIYGAPVKDGYSHPHDALQYASVLVGQDMDSTGPQKLRR